VRKVKACSFVSRVRVVALLLAFCRLVCVTTAQPAVPVSIGQNFTGSEFGLDSSALPADANGAIGPRHFVEFINGSFAAYDKTNVTQVTRMSDLIFWNDAGVSLAATQITTDPRIIYDPTVQRWFASMVDADGGSADPTLSVNDFLLAVSDTADPTATWHGFKFRSDPTTGAFADFPTLGVDSNAVYLSAEMYHGESNPLGTGLVSIPKADLLAATPTVARRTWFGVMSYDQRGQVVQPAICFDGSGTGKMIGTSDYGNDSNPHSNLVSFAVLNGSGPGATLTTSTFIPTLPWSVPDSAYLPAPAFAPVQPDGTDTLVANDARLSAKVYAVGGVLYAVHSTELNNHIAIRWYRIRASDNVLLESGTIADPNLDLFFPSIAANAAGVAVIAFNGCGLSMYISCFAVVGQTVNGVTTLGGRLLLKASTLSYHDLYEQVGLNDYSRWGDYSATSVDPSDPNRFWSIQMYAADDATFGSVWSTQITELVTAPPASLAVEATGTNVTVFWPSGFAGYQLQSATNLVPPITWSDVTQARQTNASQLSVLLPTSAGSQFFRLKK
jgi:hypothetical protein